MTRPKRTETEILTGERDAARREVERLKVCIERSDGKAWSPETWDVRGRVDIALRDYVEAVERRAESWKQIAQEKDGGPTNPEVRAENERLRQELHAARLGGVRWPEVEGLIKERDELHAAEAHARKQLDAAQALILRLGLEVETLKLGLNSEND